MKFTLQYENDAELCQKLRSILLRKEPPAERISVGELARRTGLNLTNLSTKLRRPDCPHFVSHRGKKRILWLEPNDALMRFLTNAPTNPPATCGPAQAI